MPIAFEGVSYSYADPARQEKRKSRAKRRREAGVIEDAPSLERGKPAWGGDPDAVWALRDITFELEDGEFLGIAGHTGSGKSTLIQHMNGLVSPTRGRVLLDGQDLADKRAAQACRGKVGLVFQYPEYQLFAATVREDVAFGPRNLGLSADEVERRVAAALESVRLDIAELGDKSPFELSGGQQRRVAFAGVPWSRASSCWTSRWPASIPWRARSSSTSSPSCTAAGSPWSWCRTAWTTSPACPTACSC